MVKYYFDTCIWVDLFENRVGPGGEPFGESAFRLLSLIEAQGYKLLVSDHLVKELKSKFWVESIQAFLVELGDSIIKISYVFEQAEEARVVSEETQVPSEDALHAILARDHHALLVTRDKHFNKLANIVKPFSPDALL